MSNKSILSKHELKFILDYFRYRVMDHDMVPTLLVRTATGEQSSYPLPNLPSTPEEKRRFFVTLGAALREDGEFIKEAIFVCEAWYVNSKTFPNSWEMLPSEHPKRQEALVLTGRNVDNTRSTYVIQPFTRDENGNPVWQQEMRDVDNQRSAGLLEWLFAGQKIEEQSLQD